MKNVLIFFLGMGLFFWIGCSSSDETAQNNSSQTVRSASRPIEAEVQADNYIIRQSDTVEVSVWGYPEFNTKASVKETGAVTIPLLGEINVAGFTKEQFTQQLKKKLSVYIQGDVKLTIMVASTLTQKVTVLGEVTKQQNYALTTDATLIEILSDAGGTTENSDLHQVKILRGGMNRQPIVVDLARYMENGNLDAIPIVHPGDTIFVPKKENIIRELSDFMRDAIFVFGFFRVLN